jgi:carboxyl-terminal processing protease
MGRKRLGVFLVAAAGLVLASPLAVMGRAVLDGDNASAWAAKVWDAASKGDAHAVSDLLANRPAGIDKDGQLAKAVDLLQKNLDARETKRAEQIKKVNARLDQAIAEQEGGGDLAISQALKSAVELHMLTKDKDRAALMEEPRVKNLIQTADDAARKAEARGDWLGASELYYRLDLLLEDHGTYRDDVKRETQRLAMIRMYAPKRLWELRNERRNAEIAWADKHPQDDDGPKTEDQKKRDHRPLPPYNAKGDDFREKLEGIDEQMVQGALLRSYQKHVEKTSMDKILRSGIDALRTMAQTEDLKRTFPGLADAEARAAFLRALDSEDERLAKATERLTAGDLMSLLPRLRNANEKTVRLPQTAMLHEFGNGAMGALDEFSAIIWPDEIRRFNRNTQARFKGVGIQIELDAMLNIRVVTPLDGTPAQRAGIRSGDLIKKVDGDSTEGFTLDQAVDVITGPGDTKVALTIEREVTDPDGKKHTEEHDYVLTRKEIPVTTVKGWKRSGAGEDDWDWFIDPQDKIGYVRLIQFAEKTDDDFERAIDQMKAVGLNGLVLDLRFNPGGLLDQAVAVASRFIDQRSGLHNNGMVVTTHTKDKMLVQKEAVLSGHAKLAGIPVVVLINEGSASASEIVSGAVQDYARTGDVKAVLLGARSYGKGSVQNVWQLPGGADAAVKVTTQYYHLPAGRMIHRLPEASVWGVEPDFKVDMLPQQITDALLLRQNADVLKLDEKGRQAGAEEPPNAEDLINKGIDVQLEEALVILKAEAEAGNRSLVEKPARPE